MERWIVVEIDLTNGKMSFLENAGGDQKTARAHASKAKFAPRKDTWVGVMPFDVVAIEGLNYITDKAPVRDHTSQPYERPKRIRKSSDKNILDVDVKLLK